MSAATAATLCGGHGVFKLCERARQARRGQFGNRLKVVCSGQYQRAFRLPGAVLRA